MFSCFGGRAGAGRVTHFGPMRKRLLVATAALIAVAVTLGWSPGRRYWRAGKMLSALSSSAQAAAPARAGAGRAGRGGPDRHRRRRAVSRAHLPAAGQTGGRGLIVAHGIHHEGMNERRMVPFARELARAGLVVMTPEMTDLADYRITRQGVSVIRDAAVYLSGRRDLVGDARGRDARIQLRGRPVAGRRRRSRAGGPRRLRGQRRRPPRSGARVALPDPQPGRDAGGPRRRCRPTTTV